MAAPRLELIAIELTVTPDLSVVMSGLVPGIHVFLP